MDSFIYEALLFIGASVVLVPLFQRLGFGSVLGYLIAGILLGPHGLGLIGDSQNVMRFSELGVTILLFVIGLEIQPRKLWSMRQHLFGLGGLQVIATSALFMLIGMAFGIPTRASGVLSFGLSLSSTAFAVQTLTEKNQFNTEFGRSSFSILLMQDLFAIPALAIIPALGISSGKHGMSVQGLLLPLGIIAFLVVASRPLFRQVFRIIAATRSREVFTAVALFIVLGVAALMEWIGLSAALGTFVAGVLLADSEYRHELEANIEPFKGLLMGLFFIAVGMGVSVELVVKHPVKILALALGYLILKSAVIYGSGRIFKLKHESSKMMALSIAQGGEFAFVIFGLASRGSLASAELVDVLVAVVTLSMILSPVVSLLNERFLQPKVITGERPYDEIRDEAPEVIIAGFGRFGQMFARILRAQNIPFVAMDHDARQIELVRRFGNKVYYGDVSRLDLLEAAGAEKAKYFVLAIDDVEMSIQTVKIIRERFPHLKLFVRARNRGHAYDLMDLNVENIKREVFDSSVNFVGDLLLAMGFAPKRAELIIEKFKHHDELMLKEQYQVRGDDKALIGLSERGVAQLRQVLNDEELKSYI